MWLECALKTTDVLVYEIDVYPCVQNITIVQKIRIMVCNTILMVDADGKKVP